MSEESKKTDRQMKESVQETDRQMQENAREIKEYGRHLKKLENLFTGQWGKLMESLVKGELVRLLSQRGIEVEEVLQRLRSDLNALDAETDLLVTNGVLE